MKKVIKPEDFPIEMNKENIEILARMELNYPPPIKYPPPVEYLKLLQLDFLSFDDQIKISQKVKELVVEEEKQRWDSLSKEEQEEEKRKIEASLKEGPEVFRGNILQQEWDSIDLARIEKEKKKEDGEDDTTEKHL
jgi:hypothetical protein